MYSLNTLALECNRHIIINFDGGDLSSDAGLLLIKEFAAKLGFTKLIHSKFKTNDKAVRLKLLKIAARAVRSARYITFKLCSSCPYKKEFYETLNNIKHLR